MRRFLILFLLCAGPVFAQNSPWSGQVLSGSGRPIAGALISVCAVGAAGVPCSPTVNIFSTANGITPLVQPLPTDAFGNFSFFVPPGNYEYTVTGTAIGPTTAIPFTIPCQPGITCVSANSNNVFTGNNSFPNLVSPTIGPSLGQQHSIPAVGSDVFGLLAAVQTFTNKTLTSPIINAGTLSGTFAGNHTLSGILTETNAINPCRLVNVRYVDTANTCGWSGTDFTGWLAAAYTDLPATGGKVHVVLGQYSTGCITGPCIQFAVNNKGVQIECDNAGANISAPDAAATRLSFPSLTSGVGIQFVNGAAIGQGITGCDLVGPGTGTTTGGVLVGGPGGGALTFGVTLTNANITNFGTTGGLSFGNGAGFFRMDGGQLHDSGKNLFFPSGITSATEGFRLNNVIFQNKNAALYLNSVDIESPVNDLTFRDPHFDQAQVVLNGGTGFNIGTYIEGAHIENPNGAIGTGDANALIRNINNNTTIDNVACIIDNAVAGNECISHTAGNMTVIGFGAQANAGTATNAISANCAGCGLNIYSTHYLNSITNLLTTNGSTPALFNGAFSIVDQQLSAAGCTTPAVAGNACVTPITFTLSPAMPSANYRVLCTASGTPTNIPGAPYLQGVPTTTSFTVNYIALSAAAASYPNVSCRATQN